MLGSQTDMNKLTDILNIINTSEPSNGFTTDQILAVIETVHKHLCLNYVIYEGTQVIGLVAGTAEYALDAGVLSVLSAVYYENSTGYTALQPMDFKNSHQLSPGWNLDDDATPKCYYVNRGKLGLYPTPDTTTDTGYPNVTISTANYQPLTSGYTADTTIPDGMIDGWVYVHGAIYELSKLASYNQGKATVADKERTNPYNSLQIARQNYMESQEMLTHYFRKVNIQSKPQVAASTDVWPTVVK